MAENITRENALKKLDKQLVCPLCLDPFKEPKLLSCFHVFCKSPCLEKLAARDGQSLQCPICRHIVPLPAKGVSGLPSDFPIGHVFENQEVFSKVDLSSEKMKCEICNKHQDTGDCHDCEQLACDDCQTTHSEIKSLQADAINLVPPKKAVPSCPTHSNKELEIYCETCCELICNDCTVHLHKDHNYDLVEDVFAKHKEEIVSGLRPVRENLNTVQQTLKVFDSRAKKINEQRFTVEADIHKEFDQLQRLLEQRREELLSKVGSLTQQKLKNLASEVEVIQDKVEVTQAKFESCLDFAESELATDTEEEVLAMKHSVLTRIEQINAEFDADTIQPETNSEIVFITEGKEQLETACRQFVKIIKDGDSFSPEKNFMNNNDEG